MSLLYTRQLIQPSTGYSSTPPEPREVDVLSIPRVTAFAVVVVLICIALSVGGCAGVKAFNRSQKRADASNAVKVTHILIQKAHQQAEINYAQIQVTKAEAEKRYQESVGIRRAQDEIQKTLTPLYVQHEAIQAQERIATSGRNNTIIYVPAGTNGTPVITQKSNPRDSGLVTP